MSSLRLFLLGPPRLERDGVELEIDRRKNIALIAYLAVTGGTHTRESLITLLWPEVEPSRARARLRRNLSVLKKALGGKWLVVDRETVSLDPGASPSVSSGQAVWVDVDQFHHLLQVCKEHCHSEVDVCPECLTRLAEAVELYRGDFLAGFSLRDSANFDEFQFFQTEGLRDELARALERLVRGHSGEGEYEQAIPYARRWLGLDSLHEPAHRHLMQLYAQAGQRAAALRQYQECVRILEEELGLPPSEETASLYEQIRSGLADRRVPATRPRHNLPAQTTPFIGREGELAAIKARLSDPDCRLLTLVGPGGCGKTRLALEAAADILSDAQLENFERGAFFVSLAPLRSVDGIVPAVADAIGFSFYEGGEPRQQLLDYLRQKSLLIIMDNFEHLLDGVDLVTDVLETAPDVKILSTSRARLNVGGEHRFRVGGMHFPESPLVTVTDASQYSAVELFLQGARRAQPGFELTDENLSGVVQVCRLVDGMPLGIRLASAWVEMLTPEEITAEIGRSIDFLETDRHDVPQRQRSIRAAIDHSWNLLTAHEREVMQALSVFRGGFTQEAARRVTGASLRELLALVNRSLLHRTSTGRYEMHELLRQYAEEKLDQEPAAGKAARDLHCSYYAAALQQWEADLKGRREKAALAEMGVEIENARAAWDWAAEQVQVERLDQALEGLCIFYWDHVRCDEGETACRTAASRLASAQKLTAMVSGEGPVLPAPSADGTSVAEGSADGTSVAEGRRVLARILARQADMTLGRETVNQLLRQSLAILEGPELAGYDTRAEKAFVLLKMGRTARGLDPEQARRMYEQSLALYRAVGDRWWTGELLEALSAIMAEAFGAYDEAKQLAEESLAIGRALGNPTRVAHSLLLLGWNALFLGQIEEAERLLRESIAIRRERGGRGGFAGVAWGFLWLGQFDEAHSLYEETLAIISDLGDRRHISTSNAMLGWAKAHLGQYEQARVHAQIGLAIARELSRQMAIVICCQILGCVALAEEAYAEAWQLFDEVATVSREIKDRESLDYALAVLGYAARGLGQLPQAERHFCEALRSSTEVRSFVHFLLVLPGIALLLADLGEKERAVELYALASRYPAVANSRWFEDVAGRHIAEIAATLPPDVVAAAQERGRARDLDATVKELLVELEKRQNQEV